MVDGIGKKVKSKADKALEEAKRKAKQVAREEVEGYSKTAKSQLLGEEKATSESDKSQGDSGQSQIPVVQENADEEEERKEDRKKYLELKGELDEEVRKRQIERKEKSEAWEKGQHRMMDQGGEGEKETVIVLPTSTSKRPGVPAVVKGKQGTREIARKVSG